MTQEELINLAISKRGEDGAKLIKYLKDLGYSQEDIDTQIKALQTMGKASNRISGDTDSLFAKGTKLGDAFNFIDKFTKGSADVIGDFFQSQLGKQGSNEGQALKLFNLIEKNGIGTDYGIDGLILLKDEVIDQLKMESELYSEITTKTGLLGKLSTSLQEDMKLASVEGARYGFTLKDIGDFYVGLVESTGKLTMFNKSTFDTMMPLVAQLDMTLADFSKTIADYEKIGAGADDTIKAIRNASERAITYGLSSRKIVSEMNANISKLNSYGFKNGIKSLEIMARKATEFRFSMEEVFKVADGVFDPEKAIDMVANLQVLGGAIGDLNDPLKLMYMSTNDMGGLQDAIIGAASSLATFNEEQGRFEITGANLRLAKAQADALGVSYQEFSNLAIASAERTQAAFELAGRGLNMDDKEVEFLTNLARMKDGEMKITIPESLAKQIGAPLEISLDQMTDELASELLANKKAFEKMTVEDIAMEQLTETQKMSRGIDVIAAYYRIRGTEMLKGAADALGGGMYSDLQETIDQYSKKINEQSLRNDKKEGYDMVNNIIEPIKNFGRDVSDTYNNSAIGSVINDMSGNNKAMSQNTNVPSKVIIEHNIYIKSEPFADGVARLIAKYPEQYTNMLKIDDRDYTMTFG